MDFKDRFSPIAKLTTIRILIALATAKQWVVYQLDINNAFLHGNLNEEVYMLPPQVYHKVLPGQVCLLKKSFYGLKQDSRQWNIEFTSFLKSLEFKQTSHDHCLFVKQSGHLFMILLIYVDDVNVSSTSLDDITIVKTALHNN